MGKDLDIMAQNVQEHFEDDVTSEMIGLVKTKRLENGLEVIDDDGNVFQIQVTQIERQNATF